MNAVDDQIECQEIEEGENMSIYEDSALEKTTG